MKNIDLRESVDKLLENSTSTYSYGCVMMYFDFPQMGDFHNLIKKEDIYVEEGDRTFGLEDKPHCTLLYGLEDGVSLMDVESVILDYNFNDYKIFNISAFIQDKYEVLKFEVMGSHLFEINKALKKFPHKPSEFEYNPHLTIGYLQPGTSQKYIDLFNKEGFNEFDLIPQYAVYSYPDGSKDKIQINYED